MREEVWGTYQPISPTRAIVEVIYPNGFFGMERVEVRCPEDLYEECYKAAARKAKYQGFELSRFSMFEKTEGETS